MYVQIKPYYCSEQGWYIALAHEHGKTWLGYGATFKSAFDNLLASYNK